MEQPTLLRDHFVIKDQLKQSREEEGKENLIYNCDQKKKKKKKKNPW